MDILEKTGGLDSDSGIKYCGSKEGWITILKSLASSLPATLDEIEAVYRSGDWEEYIRLVHGIKSSMRAIGAGALYEKAMRLEQAGRAGESDLIRSETEGFLGDCRKLCENISPAFFEEEKSLPEAPDELMEDAFVSFSEFLTFYDYDSIDMVIQTLEQYRVPERFKEKYDSFLDAYKRLDRDGMKDALTVLNGK